MEAALIEMLKAVPGLAFGAFVFWLWSKQLDRLLSEQGEERNAHKQTVDAVVQAFRESVVTMLERSDSRQKECSDRCVGAIERLERSPR